MAFDNVDDSIPVLIFSLLVGIVAILGNLIIIYITLRFKKFRLSIANCFIGLLAVSSLSEGIGLLCTNIYAFYREINDITSYNRMFCLGLALPGIFGVIGSQLTILWMALDRLFAIKKPLIYYQSSSRIRLYACIAFSISSGMVYAIFAMFSQDNKPISECSTGASVSKIFIGAYAVFSILMAMSIFGRRLRASINFV